MNVAGAHKPDKISLQNKTLFVSAAYPGWDGLSQLHIQMFRVMPL